MFSIIIIAVFFIGSFFFSGSEIGLITLNKKRLKREAETNFRAKRVYSFVKKPDLVLGTTLVGNNISLVVVSSVFTALIVKYNIISESAGSLLLSAFLLIFAEVLPKIIFRNKAKKLVFKLFYILKFFSVLFKPLIWVVSLINNLLSNLLKYSKDTKKELAFGVEDISYMVHEAKKSGSVKEQEHELIEEVLDFRDLTVKNIMTPRTNIVAVDIEQTIGEVIEISKNAGYTRFPVYANDIDHIQGLVVIHDFLEADNLNESVKKYIRKAYFVPEIMQCTKLLTRLQEHKTPIAVVVDEYGGTAGLISVEDLLEELVGEIEDEYDVKVEDIYKLDEHSYLIDGEVEIEQLEDELGLDLGEGDFETLAGFLINKMKKIPKQNEKYKFKNYQFILKQVTTKKIERILLKIHNDKS